jgi:hypothetical protein
VFDGSQWRPKLKLCRLSSQPMRVWGRASARTTWMAAFLACAT